MTMTPERTQAINTAARRMTDAAPSPELRARVMTRIAAPSLWTPWRLALAGGAVGAAAIALVLSWPTPASRVTQPGTDVVASAPSTAPAGVAPGGPVATAIARAADTRIAYFAPAAFVDVVQAEWPAAPGPTSTDELDWQARRVAPLATPDPLRVDALQPSPLSFDTIDITPLTVAPLTVPAVGGGR